MILQVGVKAFLRNKQGKYLLLKRAPSKQKTIDGTWDLVGGRIETGTTLLENLKREVKEETALELISEPRLICAQDIFVNEKDIHVVRLTYVVDALGEPVLDMVENVEYKWLTIDEISGQENLDAYLKEIIERKLIS